MHQRVRQRTVAAAAADYVDEHFKDNTMPRRCRPFLLLALCLATASPLLAQPNRGDRQPGARSAPGRGPSDHPSQRGRDRQTDRQQDRGMHQDGPGWQAPQHDANRGAGPDHAFRRGDRLPLAYRNRVYVVDDWRGHHLSAPPRGYHWVQTGGDYVLVAIATGVILQLLLGN
jgi:Ni/Co efflux regulator RcnB